MDRPRKKPRTTKLTVRPVTSDFWPALEDLFGRSGASNGCWCMYWRIGPAYHERPRDKNKAALQKLVRNGPPPGLVALDGDIAVGWCQLAPRDSLPWLDRAIPLGRMEKGPVWAVSCFYVRRAYRNRGVTSALIKASLKSAKREGAAALYAYPVDLSAPKTTRNLFTGVASTFARAGFRVVAGRAPYRVVMRHGFRNNR